MSNVREQIAEMPARYIGTVCTQNTSRDHPVLTRCSLHLTFRTATHKVPYAELYESLLGGDSWGVIG